AGSPVDPATAFDGYRADLLSPLVPTTGQLLAPGRWGLRGDGYVPGSDIVHGRRLPGPENGSYLGIPLVAAWLASLLWAALSRRHRARRGRLTFFALGALLAFVLSLGPKLDVGWHVTGIWMPFRLLLRLPLFKLSVPARFSALTTLAVTVTVAFGLDALIGWWARHRGASGRVLAGLTAATGAAVLAPLLPSGAVVSAAVGLPGYFSSGAVRAIAPGSTVLAYPYPDGGANEAMLWQVASGFRFDIVGGYVLTPWGAHGRYVLGGGGYGAVELEPSVVPRVLFEAAYDGDVVPGLFPVAAWSERELRTFVIRYGIDDIVAGPVRDEAYIGDFVSKALRQPAVDDDGVLVWYDVQRSPLVRAAR
ncbi:MAG TPA: hypothetical protein VMD59_02885, partial [Acidimicrobiales bacterium]|nr:hypothetical protein [Acidimicrobiales bacterium]